MQINNVMIKGTAQQDWKTDIAFITEIEYSVNLCRSICSYMVQALNM